MDKELSDKCQKRSANRKSLAKRCCSWADFLGVILIQDYAVVDVSLRSIKEVQSNSLVWTKPGSLLSKDKSKRMIQRDQASCDCHLAYSNSFKIHSWKMVCYDQMENRDPPKKKDLGVIFRKQMSLTAQQRDVIMRSLFKRGFHICGLNYVVYSWRWCGENKPHLEI